MAATITTQLTRSQVQALEDALRKYAGEVSQSRLQDILDGIKSGLSNLLNPQQVAREGAAQTVTEGLNPATFRAAVIDLLEKNNVEAIADQIDFTRKIASEVAQGAGNYVRANDEDVVEAYPAWELLRVYERAVPRGFKLGPKGALIEVPDDDWPSRWRAAAAGIADEEIILSILEATGRMVALKSSDIWQNLGDGAGGYDDALGNPYPPFAFNSGFDVNEVSDQECLDLGLLSANQKATGASVNPARLFAPIEEAA